MAKTKAELLAEKMKQQRVGAAAFEKGKAPIVETNPPAEEIEKTDAEMKVEEKTTQNATETAQNETKGQGKGKSTPKQKKPSEGKKTATETKDDSPVKLLDKIPKKKKIAKKTNAYYISVANIEKLDAAAADAGTSASDLLDNILTAVFSE